MVCGGEWAQEKRSENNSKWFSAMGNCNTKKPPLVICMTMNKITTEITK